MISDAQRQAITGTVQSVAGAQADVLVGGKPVGGDGYFFEPYVAPLFVVDSIEQPRQQLADNHYGKETQK